MNTRGEDTGMQSTQPARFSGGASPPVANQLLAALERHDRDALLERATTVELRVGETLAEQGQPLAYAYFPVGAIISLIASVDRRTRLEVSLIGYEGMLGLSLALGAEGSALRARVRGAGTALRVDAATLERALADSEELRTTLNRYACEQIVAVAQTAVCTRFHLVEERLARWLLMIHDRAGSDHLELTHGLLAEMLGVRRSGITTAAGMLRQRGFIRYTRGDITIADRAGLESASCACYRLVDQPRRST